MIDKDMKQFMIDHQFEIPKKLYYFAEEFPTVTWKRAQEIYKASVRRVLESYGEEDIFSGRLSFGKGMELVTQTFRGRMGLEDRKECDNSLFKREYTSIWLTKCDDCDARPISDQCPHCTFFQQKMANL